jgi:membrane protein required for colicin V production
MESLSINVLDMVAVAVLILSAILAFFRGFVHEVLSITAWVGAALAALYGLPYVRPKAHELISIPVAADAAAAIVLFLVVLLILSIITRAISKQVQDSTLNSLDRSLGFLFGLVRGAVILSLAYVVMSWAVPDPQGRPDWIRTARSTPLMESGGNVLRSLMPDSLVAGEDRARTAATEAKEATEQAIEAKRTFDRLTQPRPDGAPQAPAAGSTGNSAAQTPPGGVSMTSPAENDPAVSKDDPRYDDSTRQTLDRLIQSQQ